MNRIAQHIFNISPRKLAVYLLLGPLVLLLLYGVSTITIRYITGTAPSEDVSLLNIVDIIFWIAGGLFMAFWFIWLYSTSYSVGESNIGISLIWLKVAFVLVILYLIYNACFGLFKTIPEEYQSYFYMLNEFIAFGGLLIGYPVICNYSARAIYYKKENREATFFSSILFTLLLIFGTILSIPFFHKYFSTKTSTNNQILVVYAIGFGVCFILFIIGFIAAIIGLI